MAVGAVVARILTQYSDKGSKAAQKDIQKLGAKIDAFSKRAVKSFGIFAIAAAGSFAKITKDAITSASDLSETINKTNVVFGNSAKSIIEWSKNSADSFGQSQRAALDAASNFALFGKAAGLNGEGVVNFSKSLTVLASDLASIQNTTPEEAVVALGSALRGEALPLRRFNILLSEQILRQEALKIGISKTTKEALSPQQKILAAYSVIMKESTFAQGDFARTQDGLANKTRQLQATLENIKAELGTAFLPIVEKFAITIQKEVLPQIKNWIQLNRNDLARGLKSASEKAFELLKIMISIGGWIVTNFETIKNFGILLASIWATGRIYSFISAIGKVSLAFSGMQAAAIGAGAAGAAATGGAGAAATFMAGARTLGIAGAVATGITALSLGLGKVDLPGTRTRAKRLSAEREKRLSGYIGAPGPSDLATISASAAATANNPMDNYLKFMNDLKSLQDKFNNSKKKELTIEQKIINAMLKKYGLTLMTAEIEAKATAASIEANLKRQAAIAKSSPTVSLAAQGDGSATGNGSIINSGNPNVNVTINTPHGTKDDYLVEIETGLNTLQRRRGIGAGGGFFRTKAE